MKKRKKKDDGIIISGENKDVIASYIFAISQKKEVNMIEQRAVLRLVEYAQDYGLKGLRIKDNMRQIDLGLDKVVLSMPITDIAFSHYKPDEVDRALRDLRSRAFIYRYKDKNTGHPISLIAGILDRAEVEYGKGIVTLYVDNQVWQMITNFSLGFREFELNKALALPTSYALQFYMMMSGQKRPFFMSVEEMKEWLGIDPDKYLTSEGKHRIDHLEERVLSPAKKALDATCPYSFDYTKIRENPRNPRSKVIGFNFTPIYLQQNRDPQLEKAGLLSQLHSSTFMSRNVKDILRNKVGMSAKEMDSHIQLWDDVSKYIFDPEKTITEIYDRSRASNVSKPIGYLINALKEEVKKAKEKSNESLDKPGIQKSTPAAPIQDAAMAIADINNPKSLKDAIDKVAKKVTSHKVTFTKEQMQETYNNCHLDVPMDVWMSGMGYKWDEEKQVYYK